MADRLLIDTDVLIDYLRNRHEAVAYLETAAEPLLISVVTIAELYAGVKEGADALIAATAEQYQAKLVTLNRKHFPMLKDVIVPYVKA